MGLFGLDGCVAGAGLVSACQSLLTRSDVYGGINDIGMSKISLYRRDTHKMVNPTISLDQTIVPGAPACHECTNAHEIPHSTNIGIYGSAMM
jgi:hypothetical protein